jgi:hypothetical protein
MSRGTCTLVVTAALLFLMLVFALASAAIVTWCNAPAFATVFGGAAFVCLVLVGPFNDEMSRALYEALQDAGS